MTRTRQLPTARPVPGHNGAILSGTNGSTGTDYNGRALTKAVNTGWTPAEAGLASDILTLWGMADLGSEQTDTYVLSMSFDKQAPRAAPRQRWLWHRHQGC